MTPAPTPAALSRRSLILFALLAPTSFAIILATIAALQYRQFRAMVAPSALVEAPSDTSGAGALLVRLMEFSSGSGPDTLRVEADRLGALASSSPSLRERNIHLRILSEPELLVVETSQPVAAMSGRLAWLFRRMSPMEDGWLNARMEGYPGIKGRDVEFTLERGFMNGARMPRSALAKRGGLSPKDFLDPRFEPEYTAFLKALGGLEYRDGEVVLWR